MIKVLFIHQTANAGMRQISYIVYCFIKIYPSFNKIILKTFDYWCHHRTYTANVRTESVTFDIDKRADEVGVLLPPKSKLFYEQQYMRLRSNALKNVGKMPC